VLKLLLDVINNLLFFFLSRHEIFMIRKSQERDNFLSLKVLTYTGTTKYSKEPYAPGRH